MPISLIATTLSQQTSLKPTHTRFNDIKDGAKYEDWNEIYQHIAESIIETEVFARYPDIKNASIQRGMRNTEFEGV